VRFPALECFDFEWHFESVKAVLIFDWLHQMSASSAHGTSVGTLQRQSITYFEQRSYRTCYYSYLRCLDRYIMDVRQCAECKPGTAIFTAACW